MFGSHAIEHGSSRSSRWLRERRVRVALTIAAVEGLLYLVGALSWWLVVLLAAVGILLWAYAGRTSRSDALRQVTWIFAVSQVLVILVPPVFQLVKWAAITMVVLLAVGALVVLLRKRP
jgi:hypothetical protein